MPQQIHVFLSYVEDTQPFVEDFKKFFFKTLTDFKGFDWKDVPITSIDSLPAMIDQQIDAADVFIAFICSNYESGIAGKKELPRAVARREQLGEKRKPEIIPVTLTVDGRKFWKKTREKSPALGGISDMPFFNPGSDKWFLPKDNTSLLQDVMILRDGLLAKFGLRKLSPLYHSRHDAVVFLGHPSKEQDPSIAQAAIEAQNELNNISAPVAEPWPDQWSADEKDRAFPLPAGKATAASAIFVQPLAADRADRCAERPENLKADLAKVLPQPPGSSLDASRIVFWIPNHIAATEKFTALASEEKNTEASPAFRTDEPAQLARWLATQLKFDISGPVAAFEYMDLSDSGGLPAETLRMQRETREGLVEAVCAAVEPYLPGADEQKRFFQINLNSDDTYKSEFPDIADRRPILIAHDFTSSGKAALGGSDPTVELIEKLKRIQGKADAVLNGLGRTNQDAFWLACLQNSNPDVWLGPRMPHTRLQRWVKVKVVKTETGSTVLDPGTLEVAKTELNMWVSAYNPRGV